MSNRAEERRLLGISERFFVTSSIALLLFLFFVWIAKNRFLSGDEGFYLYAAKAVLNGEHVYLDFFYPQMPLLPYFYAFTMKLLGGISWDSGRLIAALVSTGCGLCVFHLIAIETRRQSSAALGALLFALTDFSFFYFPIVKAYSLSALFLLLALVAVAHLRSLPRIAPFLAGLLTAFSFEVRLYVVLVIPLFIWNFWISRRDTGEFRRSLIYFFVGGLIGSVPSIILLADSPSRFWFNNIQYHSMRSRRQFFSDLPHKVAGVGRLIGSGNKGESIQFVMLTILTGLSMVWMVFRKIRIPITTTIGVVLFIGSMLPTPMYLQYFALVVPFWSVSVVVFFSNAIYSVPPKVKIFFWYLRGFALLSFPLFIPREHKAKCSDRKSGRRLSQ